MEKAAASYFQHKIYLLETLSFEQQKKSKKRKNCGEQSGTKSLLFFAFFFSLQLIMVMAYGGCMYRRLTS